ncbi:FkbM family methyltransferase [Bacillus oleivorans]|uniref:FkbM family methyltransferase n=1 Tax=Bacillus oleivorans TaxID=1448271 RepID=A0A285CT09_9BACI|nr:FkbM family methyltransferase [Bacillus oleivorans]SNX70719.1 FkbM family methyltransferase [Bacillus oleivorans]
MKASVRKPFLLKMWENYPKLWKFLIDAGILLKYKTLKIDKLPNKIVLSSSTVLFVNSEENRGRALLISNGMTQKRMTRFWRQAVQAINPDIIIDVGVNYGECIFSTVYPSHTKIYGVEANKQLFKYIEQSKEVHPNKSQIFLFNTFAADKDDEEKLFFVDQHWSGTSSASYMPSHQMIEPIAVHSITIDSLVQGNAINKTVLFKVDVEGYEAFVLKGMTGIFDSSSAVLGFIEFNSEYIKKSGIPINEFLAFLNKYFTLYIYRADDRLVKANGLQYENLKELFNSDYIHTDMILASDEGIIEFLGV